MARVQPVMKKTGIVVMIQAVMRGSGITVRMQAITGNIRIMVRVQVGTKETGIMVRIQAATEAIGTTSGTISEESNSAEASDPKTFFYDDTTNDDGDGYDTRPKPKPK